MPDGRNLRLVYLLLSIAFASERLVVTDTLDGYEVWTTDYQRLSPLDFALRVDPDALRRYRRLQGLTTTSSVLLWVGGGVVTWSACAATVLWEAPASYLSGAYCGLGVGMLVSGFGLYNASQSVLGDYETWWDEPTARRLAEQHGP